MLRFYWRLLRPYHCYDILVFELAKGCIFVTLTYAKLSVLMSHCHIVENRKLLKIINIFI